MAGLLLAAFVAVYLTGLYAAWRHAGVGRGVRTWQALCFVLGASAVAVALVSPLDELAEELFAAHMAQHVLLAIVAPPLLVLSAPTVAVANAVPSRRRPRVVRAIKGSRATVAAWTFFTTPVIACAVHAVALWVWHAPLLYAAALEHPALHALEHLSFLGTALLLWWSIIHPRRARREAYGIGIVMLFVTMLHSGALGALIAMSHRVWYPLQTRAEQFGLTPLDDQHLAGLIMWVPGGFLYLVAMGVLFVAFMRSVARCAPVQPRSGALVLAEVHDGQ
jgi:cytochrome c oxidase assembly factor CtaG